MIEKMKVKFKSGEREFIFGNGINIIYGKNATGKTRLLNYAFLHGANFVEFDQKKLTVNKLAALVNAKQMIKKTAELGKTLLIDDFYVIPKEIMPEIVNMLKETGLQVFIATVDEKFEVAGAEKIVVGAEK